MNADDKEQLKVEKTDDLCKVDFIDIDPLARDTNLSCTTECVDEDWSAEVTQENLVVVKQEPNYVCCFLCPTYLLIALVWEAMQSSTSVHPSVCLPVSTLSLEPTDR